LDLYAVAVAVAVVVAAAAAAAVWTDTVILDQKMFENLTTK
jgi:hypothetical protein